MRPTTTSTLFALALPFVAGCNDSDLEQQALASTGRAWHLQTKLDTCNKRLDDANIQWSREWIESFLANGRYGSDRARWRKELIDTQYETESCIVDSQLSMDRLVTLEGYMKRSIADAVVLSATDREGASQTLHYLLWGYARAVCQASPDKCTQGQYPITSVTCTDIVGLALIKIAGEDLDNSVWDQATDLLAAKYHCKEVDKRTPVEEGYITLPF